MSDIEHLLTQLKQEHSELRRNMDTSYQQDVLRTEAEHAQNQLFLENVRRELGNRNDNLVDWQRVARQTAQEIAAEKRLAGSLYEKSLYDQFVALAESGIADFHAARRSLGLSETP